MKKWIKNIHKKLNNSSGLSIGEMLATVLIVSLLTTGLTTVMSLAVRQYNNSMRTSEANVLTSTLKTIITNELAYTTQITLSDETSGEVGSFQSQNYVIKDSLSSFIIDPDTKDSYGYGKVLIGTEETSKKLLGDGSYPRGLGVDQITVFYDKNTNYFTVEYSIGAENKKYVETSFQIKALNQVTITIS